MHEAYAIVNLLYLFFSKIYQFWTAVSIYLAGYSVCSYLQCAFSASI